MDYFGIIKKAYEITIKHKFLWIFGILAGGIGGFKGSNSFNYSAGGADFQQTFNNVDATKLEQFWTIWGGMIVTVIVILGALGLVFFILNIISQGALVGSTEKISKNEKANFKTGFGIGSHQFWRVLGMLILYGLMILASAAIWILPTILFVITKVYIMAIIWGLLLFFVCLAFWILIGVISPYSIRVVVLEKFGIFQSIRESLHFVRNNLKEVILIYLLLFAIGIGFGIALILAILIVGGLLLAIGFGVYLASLLVTIGYGIVAGLALFIAIMIISGIYNAFTSSVITLTYLELNKKS